MGAGNGYFETFANKLCEYAMKKFVIPYLRDHGVLQSYRAQIVSKDTASKTMTVQRPFDQAITLPYTDGAAQLSAGDGCVVLSLGESTNAAVFADGMLNQTGYAEAAPWNAVWSQLTLQSGVTGSVYYWKDPNGMVWLKIATGTDTAAAAQVLGVLPEGYRPEFVHIFFGYNTDHGYTLRYTVSSDGTIRAYAFLNPPSTILNANTVTFKTCRGYTAFCAK